MFKQPEETHEAQKRMAMNKPEEELSKCHNAPVTIGGDSDEGTRYYVCNECGNACDLAHMPRVEPSMPEMICGLCNTKFYGSSAFSMLIHHMWSQHLVDAQDPETKNPPGTSPMVGAVSSSIPETSQEEELIYEILSKVADRKDNGDWWGDDYKILTKKDLARIIKLLVEKS